MEKLYEHKKRDVCPVCGARDININDYAKDGDTIVEYFTCDNCGAACCNYYEHSITTGVVEEE